jgi:hypothetical protein
MVIAGIDPGKKGAIAIYDFDAAPLNRLRFIDMPLVGGEWDPHEFLIRAAIIKGWHAEFVFIEECHAFPGIGAATNASVMEGFGMWRVALASQYEAQHTRIVPSNVWKPAMGLTVPLVKAGKKATAAEKRAAYLARKQKSLEVARHEFGIPFRTRKGADMDGHAEAALLAKYGYLILNQLRT